MKRTIKKYFIPHEGNNYHPHILHAKRTIFYGLFFSALKIGLMFFVIFLPAEVFVLPDVLAEEQRQIIALTNDLRVEKGKAPLKDVNLLDLSSQHKADDMAAKEYFAHSNDGKSVTSWMRGVGYKYEVAGENLAVGYSTADEVVAAWVNSPTHYSNLLDSDFSETGVGIAGGVYNGQPTVFIAQHFALPAKDEPTVKREMTTLKTPKGVVITSSSRSVLAEKVENKAVPVVVASVGSTPIDKYIHARTVLRPITSIFDVSRTVFLGAMVFFIMALALKIFIEFRRQHPHVIFQTTMLIMLLFVLWKF
jgi:hypothetical protein